MRREERVTVQGLVKEQQPDGMSHRGAETGQEALVPVLRGSAMRRVGGFQGRGPLKGAGIPSRAGHRLSIPLRCAG